MPSEPSRSSRDRLLETLDFFDDALWCDQRAADLRPIHLTLAATSAGQRTSVRLNVDGVENPLYDPRIPTLIVAVRQYQSTDAVALFGADRDWRVVASTGEPLLFKATLSAPLLKSSPLEADTVHELAAANGILAVLFPADARVA